MLGREEIFYGVFAFALVGSAVIPVSAQELEPDTLKVCEKQLKSKNSAESFVATWRLAGHYRAKGELKTAEKILKDIASTRDFERLPQSVAIEKLRCILELAHVKALQEDVNGSLALLNWAEQRKDEFQRSVSLIKYAEILFDLGEFERGGEYQKSGDKLIVKNLDGNPDGVAIGQGDKGVDKSAAWGELKLKSDDLARELEFEMMKQKYGASYALYVKLRRCQYLLKRNFIPRYRKEAFSIADEIIETDPKSQFAEAAKYLKGAILSARVADESDKKQIKEAKDYLEKFVKENPDGLYRGEALMLLGKISLECEWNANESEKYYKDALAYFQKAQAKRDTLSLYAPMSDELKKQSEPTTPLVGVNSIGNLKLNEQDPLKLYNTANSSSWYLNEQIANCALSMMFFSWNKRNRGEAGKYMEILRSNDDYQRARTAIGEPSIIRRYLAVMDYDDPLFSDKELEGLSSIVRLQMGFLEHCYICDRGKMGAELAIHLLKNPKLTKQERGSLLLALAKVSSLADDYRDSQQNVLKEAMANLDPKSEIYAIAMWNYARTFLDYDVGKRINLYTECMKRFPNSRYISLVHADLILDYSIGGGFYKSKKKFQNLAMAKKLFEDYKKRYKKPYYGYKTIEKFIVRLSGMAEREAVLKAKGLSDNEIDAIIVDEFYAK